MKLPKKYPHLNGAMLLTGNTGTGMCIHRSAAFVLDVPGSELCFGTLAPARPEEINATPHLKLSAVPFIHAWVEWNGKVYSPSMIEYDEGKLLPIDREFYYRTRGVSDIHRLNRKTVIHLSGKIGLSAHLKHGKPNKLSVGGTLLDAAGVKWQMSEDGGLIPREENHRELENEKSS